MNRVLFKTRMTIHTKLLINEHNVFIVSWSYNGLTLDHEISEYHFPYYILNGGKVKIENN